jgi:hypothetical protein
MCHTCTENKRYERHCMSNTLSVHHHFLHLPIPSDFHKYFMAFKHHCSFLIVIFFNNSNGLHAQSYNIMLLKSECNNYLQIFYMHFHMFITCMLCVFVWYLHLRIHMSDSNSPFMLPVA